MTDIDSTTSIVRVAIFEDEDYEIVFSDMAEASEDIATISDFDIIALIADHMKITVEELNAKVYGSGSEGKQLIVSRPEAGNILIHTEMVLGKEDINEETANRAAKWWASQLRNGAKLDNGDDSDAGAMTFMMASIAQQTFSDEQVDKFESELTKAITGGKKNYSYPDGMMIIFVDYHADPIFDEAAKVAGFELGMSDLPWKTTMWIYPDGKVEVAEGYRVGTIEL